MRSGEVCNRNVVIMSKDETIQEAARLMRHHHVGSILVCDNSGKGPTPLGILTDRDIVVELLAEGVAPDAVCTGDIMTFELLTTHEEDDLEQTLEKMLSRAIRRIPVVDDNAKVVGILSLDDLLEFFAEQFNRLVTLINAGLKREQLKRP